MLAVRAAELREKRRPEGKARSIAKGFSTYFAKASFFRNLGGFRCVLKPEWIFVLRKPEASFYT
jgi:hypothetical protein